MNIKCIISGRLLGFGIMGLLAGFPVQAADQFLLVEATDNVREVELSVLSQEEYRTLQDDTMYINSQITRGLAAAKKEWQETPQTKDLAFPSSIIGPAKVRILSMHIEKAKADAALAEAKAKLEQEEKKKSGYLQKKVDALKESLENPPKDTKTLSRDQWIANVKHELGINMEELAKQEKEKAERERIITMAKELVRRKITELRAAKPPAK